MLLFFGISATASFSKCEEHSRLGKSDIVIKKNLVLFLTRISVCGYPFSPFVGWACFKIL